MLEQCNLLTNPTVIYEPEPESEYGQEFRNDNQAIRRCFVRTQFYNNVINNKDVVNLYTEWRDDPEYFILRGIEYDKLEQQRIIRKDDEPYYTWELPPDFEYLYRFIKASKRGNDVYKRLVDKRLKPIDELYDIPFFDDEIADKRTNALFITLTYDNKLCDEHTAWKRIGEQFHLFHNNLRKQYGKVEIFRTWEATNHYYPHIHVMVLFWDKTFPVIKHVGKDGVISYRIPYNEKEKIAKYWHSNIDIQALQSVNEGVKELTKYITKDLCSNKGDKTNAMIWFHRKQGYAISKGFVEMIKGWNIEITEPGNADLINDMCNCNQDIIEWEFLGILRGRDLGFCSEIHSIDYKKPPPKVINMVIAEQKRWNSRRISKAEMFSLEGAL